MPKQNISKGQYIVAAHKIIFEEGLEALSIRRLANDLRCNTANLYRYFSGVEELAMYAALGYLKDYLSEVSRLLERETDCLARHFGVWDCFSKHAFANAPIFDLLFFGKYNRRLYIVMKEYYELFPQEIVDLGSLRTVFLQGDFDYRDYLMLDECVKRGCIDDNDAVMLNRFSINLFKGYFKKVLDLSLGPQEQDHEREKFLEVIHFVFDRVVRKP